MPQGTSQWAETMVEGLRKRMVMVPFVDYLDPSAGLWGMRWVGGRGGKQSRTVLVTGPSMLPTLREGDCLLVRPGARIRSGDIVVARLRQRRELLVVKRTVEERDGGWLLAADNPAVEGHGLTGGVGDVEAKVLLRYWPWPVRKLS